MQKCYALNSGTDNQLWLHFLQIPPPKNSSTATVGRIWMLCMYICCVSEINGFPVSKDQKPTQKLQKTIPPPPIFKRMISQENIHHIGWSDELHQLSCLRADRKVIKHTLFDFKLWVKNLLKMHGFQYTALFCGILNLWAMMPTNIQSLSSLINIYIRETWENQRQDMLSSDTHSILRSRYSLLSNFN